MSSKRVNYRKLAFEKYPPFCVHCGFGIKEVLEVAHIDGNRSHNEPANLVILCPTCHRMHDLDLISTETIRVMRDRPKIVVQAKRMKDAGPKSAETRKRRKAAKRRKRHLAAVKAAQTRKENTMRNPDRLTPSEIESLRQDKRDALKKMREKSGRAKKLKG
jgi:hypothetical protein